MAEDNVVQLADENAPLQRPEIAEIAVIYEGKDITRGYIRHDQIEVLPDELLVANENGIDLYEDTLSDPQVKAGMQQRILALAGAEWTVTTKGTDARSKAAADSIREIINNIGWDRIRSLMHYGVYYGFSFGEALWAQDGREVILEDIRVRDRRRFRFQADREPRLLTMQNSGQGEELPPRKFWHFVTGGTHDDLPYGCGLAHWLHWYVHFKRHGHKYWLIDLEKYGSPTSIGKFPSDWINPNTGAPNAAAQRVLLALKAIQTDASVAVPDSVTIELLAAARNAGESHALFVKGIDKAIAKLILGQTLTLDDDGGQYKAEVHKVILDSIVKADGDLLYSTFNETMGKWLTDWNYPGAVYPKVWGNFDEPEDLDKLAERYAKLHVVGFKPTLKRIEEDFGEGFELVSAPTILPGDRRSQLPQPPQLQSVGFADFSSTQLNFDRFDVSEILSVATQTIAEDDIHPDKGLETEPHVTILYGIESDDPAVVRDLMNRIKWPIVIKVMHVSVFRPVDEDFEAIVLRVESEQLRALNDAVRNTTDVVQLHPNYLPHVTLGYVKKGRGVNYSGVKTGLEDQTLWLREAAFVSSSDVVTVFEDSNVL